MQFVGGGGYIPGKIAYLGRITRTRTSIALKSLKRVYVKSIAYFFELKFLKGTWGNLL